MVCVSLCLVSGLINQGNDLSDIKEEAQPEVALPCNLFAVFSHPCLPLILSGSDGFIERCQTSLQKSLFSILQLYEYFVHLRDKFDTK